MKSLSASRIITAALLLAASLSVGRGQSSGEDAKGMEATIRQYFTAMGARDIVGLRAALETNYVVVKSGPRNARSYVADTTDASRLLPRTDEWVNAKVTDVKPEILAGHPSVGTATFTVKHPLDAKDIAAMKDMLKDPPPEFDAAQRKEAEKMIAERAASTPGFAMLTKRDGRWKIVCLTLPKN